MDMRVRVSLDMGNYVYKIHFSSVYRRQFCSVVGKDSLKTRVIHASEDEERNVGEKVLSLQSSSWRTLMRTRTRMRWGTR